MNKYKITEKTGASIEYICESPRDWTAMGHGLPERWERHETQPEIILDQRTINIDAVVDELGNEIRPASSHQEYLLPAEYTVEVTDITAEVEQQNINREALEYLKSTDWLIIREIDSGEPCPQEIKNLRAAARVRIV